MDVNLVRGVRIGVSDHDVMMLIIKGGGIDKRKKGRKEKINIKKFNEQSFKEM